MRSHRTVIAAVISAIVLLMGSWNQALTQEIDDRPAYRVYLRMEKYLHKCACFVRNPRAGQRGMGTGLSCHADNR